MRNVLVLACVAAACHGPPRRELVFELDTKAPGCTPDARSLERAAETLRERVEASGVPEPEVFVRGDTVIASLSAGLDEEIVTQLGLIAARVGKLAIDRLADDPLVTPAGAPPVADHVAPWRTKDGPLRSLATTGVNGAAIDRVRMFYATPESPAVKISLTHDGARRMVALAGAHVAIVLDDIIRGDFVLPTSIGTELTLVTSGATADERARNANDMTAILKTGAATCPLVLRSSATR